MKRTNAIVLLYTDDLRKKPHFLRDHVEAFSLYSEYGILPVNTDAPVPHALHDHEFQGVIAHYSFFGPQDQAYLTWLDSQPSAYKIAFIQDEYDYCPTRFAFLNRFDFDCVFTLLEPRWHGVVYGQHTGVRRIVTTLPGYVSDRLVSEARRREQPDDVRDIDVGYRARRLPYFMGRGGQEKHLIAVEWERRSGGMGLALDLDTAERSRLHGDDWYDFLARCRGVLGVEAGTSTFDLDGSLRQRCDLYLRRHPNASFEEVSQEVIAASEGRIYYRTISPRHFEAAAFRCVQILFEGRYSGILQPDRHYLPLKKDFSNFEETVHRLQDKSVREALTTIAYQELIASGRYSYATFIRDDVDSVLRDAGLVPDADHADLVQLRNAVSQNEEEAKLGRLRKYFAYRAYHLHFPGRAAVGRLAKSVGIRRSGQVNLEDGDPALLQEFGRGNS